MAPVIVQVLVILPEHRVYGKGGSSCCFQYLRITFVVNYGLVNYHFRLVHLDLFNTNEDNTIASTTTNINWNIIESGVKHHNPTLFFNP